MSYTFETIIKKISDKDAAYIEVPFDVEKEFGAKRVKVKVMFDNIPYRGSIVKMGLPCYMIGMTKEIRKQLGKEAGEMVKVEVEKDEEAREVVMPEDFMNLLSSDEMAKAAYEKLSYSAKRKYYQWITEAKKEETKEKRVLSIIEELKK